MEACYIKASRGKSATLYHRKRDAISPQARRYITASATLYHRKRDAIPMKAERHITNKRDAIPMPNAI